MRECQGAFVPLFCTGLFGVSPIGQGMPWLNGVGRRRPETCSARSCNAAIARPVNPGHSRKVLRSAGIKTRVADPTPSFLLAEHRVELGLGHPHAPHPLGRPHAWLHHAVRQSFRFRSTENQE